MRRYYLILAAPLALAACATSASTDTANALAAAEVGLTGAEQAATLYVQLPLCGQPGSPALCSTASISTQIKAAAAKADSDLALAKAVNATVSADTVLSDIAALTALIPVSTAK